MLIEKNPYEVLDLRPTATQKQIRTKYRLLVQKYHPDLHPGDTAAALLMGQVNSAYDIIGNPKTRRWYDEKLNASTGAAEATEAQAEEAQQPFEKTEEQTSYGAATVEETEAAEAWAKREAQATREKGFVSSVWAEVAAPRAQEYSNGWASIGHLAWLIFRVIIAIFILLLRFLFKNGDEDNDFLKF